MAAEDDALNPIKQFEIHTFFPLEIGGLDLSFTNASYFMVMATGITIAGLAFAMSKRSLVPSRAQSVAEILYEFVAGMIRDFGFQFGEKTKLVMRKEGAPEAPAPGPGETSAEGILPNPPGGNRPTTPDDMLPGQRPTTPDDFPTTPDTLG